MTLDMDRLSEEARVLLRKLRHAEIDADHLGSKLRHAEIDADHLGSTAHKQIKRARLALDALVKALG